MPKNKFKNRTSKDVFNKEEANNVKWRVSMGGVKKTLKKKIIGGCSKFIKYNRKHRRVSYKRKRKCLVKTWLGDFFSLQRFFLSDVLVFSLLSRFELLFFYMKFLFNWDFCFFLFIFFFLKQCFYLKFWSLEVFWNLIDFGSKKSDGKNIRWRQQKMVGKVHKLIKQSLLSLFTWNQIFLGLRNGQEIVM